jgi:hypothetical protein
MKFDMLCNIVLEGKKQQKFARINVTNPTPTFLIDDVLRDPNDPSRGVKTYLDEQLKGSETGEPVDEERIARRALRRLNWVAGSLIKRVGSRELDLRKLHLNIIILLEKYLTNVMRYSDEQIEKMELKIAKEAAFIGNLLLPPTDRLPNAKGVFSITNDSIDYKRSKGDEEEYSASTADRLAKEFNMTVDEYIAAFDPDLIGTIKEIIRDGSSNTSAPVENEEDNNFGAEDIGAEPEGDEGEEIAKESVDNALGGVSVGDILKDPRIKNVYDPRIVRKVIKSMLSLGSIKTTEAGKLTLAEPGEEDWRIGLDRARNRAAGAGGDVDVLPPEGDIKDLAQTFGDNEPGPSDADLDAIEGDKGDEGDEEDIPVDAGSGIAARRLGYKKFSSAPEGAESEEEDEGEKPWYKQ